MAKKYAYTGLEPINFPKDIIEAYEIMDRCKLNYKVIEVKVPDIHFMQQVCGLGMQKQKNAPYTVPAGTKDKTNGENAGTCYDLQIVQALESYAALTKDYKKTKIRVTIPVYEELKSRGIIS